MGILDFFMGIEDPLSGAYRLTSCSVLKTRTPYSSCIMTGEVSGAGIPSRTVRHESPLAPRDRWPVPGQVLPVTVDRNDPEQLRVLWDQVPLRAE
jgi:hypothetical protein